MTIHESTSSGKIPKSTRKRGKRKRTNHRCNDFKNEAERRMIDAIREHVLGLDPLYYDAKTYQTDELRFNVESHCARLYTADNSYHSNGMKKVRI